MKNIVVNIKMIYLIKKTTTQTEGCALTLTNVSFDKS